MSQQQEPDSPGAPNKPELTEVLPKAGLVYSEKGNLSEVLCKPKLLPLKVRGRARDAGDERRARGRAGAGR